DLSPARAGMDRPHHPRPNMRPTLPRTRGDGPSSTAAGPRRSTSPPHARGWTLLRQNTNMSLTLSPARAGMDPVLRSTWTLEVALPRTRGDGPLLWGLSCLTPY